MISNPRKRKKQRNGSDKSRPNDPENPKVDPQLDVIDFSSWYGDEKTVAQRFYQQYISRRRPCIIENWVGASNVKAPPEHSKDPVETTCDHVSLNVSAPAILKALLQSDTGERDGATNLSAAMVQVERRPSTTDRFGQSRSPQRQRRMTMLTFLEKICGIRNEGDEFAATAALKCDGEDVTNEPDESSLYYLSTQETASITTDDSMPPAPFFGPPCDRLQALNIIPSSILLAGNLVLSSCNLWMGRCASTATHSGLHHDYHDNFYLLLLGRKEFILYPPHDAYHVAMSGDIECIHPNGLISYQNASIQSDGRPKLDESDIRTSKIVATSVASNSKAAVDEDSSAESDAVFNTKDGDVVIGKGFDYESSDDDYVNGDVWSDDAEYALDNKKEYGEEDEDENEAMLPNNFSWIDPVTMKPDKIVETFPSYARAKPVRVHLRANQCLYLPSSWLHCVISQGNIMTNDTASKEAFPANGTLADGVSIPSSVHMAINYWYHPPNCLDNFEHPYTDRDYWKKM